MWFDLFDALTLDSEIVDLAEYEAEGFGAEVTECDSYVGEAVGTVWVGVDEGEG